MGAWRAGVVDLPCFSYLAMNRLRVDSGEFSRVCSFVGCVCVCAVGLLVVEFGCIDSVPCTLCVASCGREIYIYVSKPRGVVAGFCCLNRVVGIKLLLLNSRFIKSLRFSLYEYCAFESWIWVSRCYGRMEWKNEWCIPLVIL